MSLKQWADNGWLRPHKTRAKEVAGLLAIVERDLVDAEGEISADWRFGIAYNAALKLCTILLYTSGYRPERSLQHYRTIAALPLILGDERKTTLTISRLAARSAILPSTRWRALQLKRTPQNLWIL